jgi:hypothetical protein
VAHHSNLDFRRIRRVPDRSLVQPLTQPLEKKSHVVSN